jgi:hypothetical protein
MLGGAALELKIAILQYRYVDLGHPKVQQKTRPMGIEGRERMQATVYAAERICASRFLVIGEDGDLIRALKNRQALTVDEFDPG